MLRGRLSLTAHVWYSTQRPDLDISLVLDLLQGRIYRNDRQVREMHLHHHIDREQPRTRLHIQEIEDDDDDD
jgi:Holliday junction resolvase RusA-like endonuclease